MIEIQQIQEEIKQEGDEPCTNLGILHKNGYGLHNMRKRISHGNKKMHGND